MLSRDSHAPDNEPLFRFLQPLLPGLVFENGGRSLQHVDGDTADEAVLRGRLLLSNLSPLHVDTGEAEILTDLDDILVQLGELDIVHADRELKWIARVAPSAGRPSTSAVLQMSAGQGAPNLSFFQRHKASLSWHLSSWTEAEVARLNSSWRSSGERSLCLFSLGRFNAKYGCRFGARCRDSHSIEDLRRMQRRDELHKQAPSSASAVAACPAESI